MTALVAVTVPPARGCRGFTRDRLTFAVLVAGVDRARDGAEAIVGERVHGRVEAAPGSLALVYGEDRAPLDGRLVQHCVDLYRVEPHGGLRRLDFGTFPADWLPAALDAIERAQAGAYDDGGDREREAVPLTLPPGRRLTPPRPPLAALLVVVALAAGLAGATAPARADVRSTAAWSTTLGRGEWWQLPASVCGGALPSDYEAWSTRTGRRVGDARLFHGTHPSRIVGSSYRGVVHVYVWCEHDDTAPSWPMLRIIDAAVGKRP